MKTHKAPDPLKILIAAPPLLARAVREALQPLISSRRLLVDTDDPERLIARLGKAGRFHLAVTPADNWLALPQTQQERLGSNLCLLVLLSKKETTVTDLDTAVLVLPHTDFAPILIEFCNFLVAEMPVVDAAAELGLVSGFALPQSDSAIWPAPAQAADSRTSSPVTPPDKLPMVNQQLFWSMEGQVNIRPGQTSGGEADGGGQTVNQQMFIAGSDQVNIRPETQSARQSLPASGSHSSKRCPHCQHSQHLIDAQYCEQCGRPLNNCS